MIDLDRIFGIENAIINIGRVMNCKGTQTLDYALDAKNV